MSNAIDTASATKQFAEVDLDMSDIDRIIAELSAGDKSDTPPVPDAEPVEAAPEPVEADPEPLVEVAPTPEEIEAMAEAVVGQIDQEALEAANKVVHAIKIDEMKAELYRDETPEEATSDEAPETDYFMPAKPVECCTEASAIPTTVLTPLKKVVQKKRAKTSIADVSWGTLLAMADGNPDKLTLTISSARDVNEQKIRAWDANLTNKKVRERVHNAMAWLTDTGELRIFTAHALEALLKCPNGVLTRDYVRAHFEAKTYSKSTASSQVFMTFATLVALECAFKGVDGSLVINNASTIVAKYRQGQS
jgi:hypothetical protein